MRHQDRLAGLHGNTQVPKILGSLVRFAYTGDPGDGCASEFFWDAWSSITPTPPAGMARISISANQKAERSRGWPHG